MSPQISLHHLIFTHSILAWGSLAIPTCTLVWAPGAGLVGTVLLETQGAPGPPARGEHPPRQNLYLCVPEDTPSSTHTANYARRRTGGIHSDTAGESAEQQHANTEHRENRRSRTEKQKLGGALPYFFLLLYPLLCPDSAEIFFFLHYR